MTEEKIKRSILIKSSSPSLPLIWPTRALTLIRSECNIQVINTLFSASNNLQSFIIQGVAGSGKNYLAQLWGRDAYFILNKDLMDYRVIEEELTGFYDSLLLKNDRCWQISIYLQGNIPLNIQIKLISLLDFSFSTSLLRLAFFTKNLKAINTNFWPDFSSRLHTLSTVCLQPADDNLLKAVMQDIFINYGLYNLEYLQNTILSLFPRKCDCITEISRKIVYYMLKYKVSPSAQWLHDLARNYNEEL